jgi:hypothetical protein
MNKIIGFSHYSKHTIQYPNKTLALRSVPHDDSMPVPKPPEPYTLDSDSELEENKIGHSVQKQHQVRRMWHILFSG